MFTEGMQVYELSSGKIGIVLTVWNDGITLKVQYDDKTSWQPTRDVVPWFAYEESIVPLEILLYRLDKEIK